MDQTVPFGGGAYFICLALLVFGRGMDILSTRVATPNLILEGNPIAKKLGWTGNIILSVAICCVFGLWPLPAIVITTTSVLIAARNFQNAWLMRSMGEEAYRAWHVARLMEAPLSLFLFCLAGQSVLPAMVGAALIMYGGTYTAFGIGVGTVCYATAVAFYTLLAVWRIRRAPRYLEFHEPGETAKGESKDDHVLTHS